MREYCPNCVVELTPQKRKLGKWSKSWLVCPECGYRIRPKNFREIANEIDEYNKMKDLDLSLKDEEDLRYG